MANQPATIALDFRGLDQLNFGNGQYRYCVDLIRGLARLESGCRFIVTGSRPAPVEPLRHVFSDPRWRYVYLPTWDFRGGDYLDYPRYAWFLRRHAVDLLHSLHTFVPLLCRTRGVITIYDMMSELFPEYRASVLSRPYRLFKYAVRRQSPLVIAISQTTADDINRLWGVPRSNIAVVYLGTDSAASSSRPATETAAEFAARSFVLSPFNLEPRKNLISLLRAMVDVRRSHPDVRLVLYGRAAVTPDRERQFHADVRELGLQDAVVPTGFVPDEELAFLYRQAALFVFPSLYEGFGMPVLEAMRAGACVVARNQSAMAEVLGDAGVQTETKDPAGLAAIIRSLLDDPARRAELGRAGQRRSAGFTSEAMARNTLAVYMRALDRAV